MSKCFLMLIISEIAKVYFFLHTEKHTETFI